MSEFDMDEEEFLLQYFEKSPIFLIKDVQNIFYKNTNNLVKSFFININSKTSTPLNESELKSFIEKFLHDMQPCLFKICDNFELKSRKTIFRLPSEFYVENYEMFSDIKSTMTNKMGHLNELIRKIEWARKEKKEIQQEILQLDQSLILANNLIDQIGKIISTSFNTQTKSTQELFIQLRNLVTERSVTLKLAKDYFDDF